MQPQTGSWLQRQPFAALCTCTASRTGSESSPAFSKVLVFACESYFVPTASLDVGAQRIRVDEHHGRGCAHADDRFGLVCLAQLERRRPSHSDAVDED
jgi:hypothetical protein